VRIYGRSNGVLDQLKRQLNISAQIVQIAISLDSLNFIGDQSRPSHTTVAGATPTRQGLFTIDNKHCPELLTSPKIDHLSNNHIQTSMARSIPPSAQGRRQPEEMDPFMIVRAPVHCVSQN
jgi:hypothetical protein